MMPSGDGCYGNKIKSHDNHMICLTTASAPLFTSSVVGKVSGVVGSEDIGGSFGSIDWWKIFSGEDNLATYGLCRANFSMADQASSRSFNTLASLSIKNVMIVA